MKEFFEINLLYGAQERKKREYLRQKYKAIILLLIFILPLAGGVNFFLNVRIKHLRAKLSNIEKELKRTDKLLEEREYLLDWKENYEEIFGFLAKTFRRPIKWFKVLEIFSLLTPEEIWFNKMSIEEDGVLRIIAYVSFLNTDKEMFKKINEFLEALRKDSTLNTYFKNPVLEDVCKKKIENKEYGMEFKIVMFPKAKVIFKKK